jgi:hypothetical protein
MSAKHPNSDIANVVGDFRKAPIALKNSAVERATFH